MKDNYCESGNPSGLDDVLRQSLANKGMPKSYQHYGAYGPAMNLTPASKPDFVYGSSFLADLLVQHYNSLLVQQGIKAPLTMQKRERKQTTPVGYEVVALTGMPDALESLEKQLRTVASRHALGERLSHDPNSALHIPSLKYNAGESLRSVPLGTREVYVFDTSHSIDGEWQPEYVCSDGAQVVRILLPRKRTNSTHSAPQTYPPAAKALELPKPCNKQDDAIGYHEEFPPGAQGKGGFVF